ncbi:Histidine kinase-, DNA gyrase B-, and HSP90-like ATPase [Mucilaginibacter lappiensis]|uniref:histidine kinase n=1 Tax=Mucilaginibacter lappiensis TaxID=354630 RepID=A0ABR6PK29_9SPHI|nr:HAMP domain-containing sensor histidine kinase [Mucilaginibacter lappiensis]MBB6110123.1 signal transduction histidine kinase [Mucilaginibacter lappiensis]SIR52409.1 Histidine kinase-, DNA gyrase B-, and HSP90-like ATPase [Mucilaginibacter lappiensis]
MASNTPTLSNLAVCSSACQPGIVKPHDLNTSAFHQIKDFFSKILNTDDWPARWHCGNWTDFHGWLYILSDVGIWAAYFAIPFLLIRVAFKRNDIPFYKVFWLFIAFILLCGLTHFIDVVIFWWPAYRLSALIRFVTAVVSIFTVYALYKILPLVFTLRTVTELETEINKRRVIEEKLAASEFLLSEAGRISRVGGWELDVIQNKTTWSKTVFDIYGLPYDFAIAENDMMSYFPEPYRQMLVDALDKAYTQGLKWDVELLMVNAKKNTIWVRSIGEPLYDEKRVLVKLRGVFIDIDQYKSTEMALHKSIGLITQSNQQLKNFTHILSHNIRNHAHNISLISSLIDKETLDTDNADLFEKLDNVSKALNTTLNDLSEAIKIKENTIKSELIDFNTIIKKALGVLESELTASHANVELHFEVSHVNFPPIYLESIFLNLISNAIKYKMPNKHPHIILKTYKNQQNETVLECQDNGQGIDLDLYGKKIFGLYKTFHQQKDAHGVGLFLVKTQIESQGGRIEVMSSVGNGATFKLIFNETSISLN